MRRPGSIAATLFTLASLAALGSEAGVLPLREMLLAIGEDPARDLGRKGIRHRDRSGLAYRRGELRLRRASREPGRGERGQQMTAG